VSPQQDAAQRVRQAATDQDAYDQQPMKKSNTILEAREHELYHLTQRNVHPRAEYTRHSNQKRQVILLCAEDIGDMGIAEYQKEKRANFVLSGLLDVPATVTALFIYNNRGLSVRNMELNVVRV